MTIKNEILDEIKKYCLSNFSEESCGFIVENNNELKFIPVENRHFDKSKYFAISPKDYLKIKQEYAILYLFHSHLSNSFFSELDILHQKYHNIDMLIYNINTDEFIERKCK